jgi:hypothetical protein
MEQLANIGHILIMPFLIINGLIIYRIATRESADLKAILRETDAEVKVYAETLKNNIKENIDVIQSPTPLTKKAVVEILNSVDKQVDILLTEHGRVLDKFIELPMPTVAMTLIGIGMGIMTIIEIYNLLK